MAINASVFWSVSLAGSSLPKARTQQVPAILDVLGEPEFGYDLFAGKETGEVIFATYQNLTGAKPSALVLQVLERAYRLGNGWSLYNLNDLSGKKLSGTILGSWINQEGTAKAPRRSMLFEIAPKTVVKRTKAGVWQIK